MPSFFVKYIIERFIGWACYILNNKKTLHEFDMVIFNLMLEILIGTFYTACVGEIVNEA
ncbi:hypothetical protein RchiOBHm_Chr4g0407581 [Rosa chinensis]|uniref:Uncharacterized protein n=1 Tax=Rosa chinensis TaxID=74649 RepID=A0A2P6QUL6_ROSCH|nr:hypothetical protein RchiOBHm_Chr4g0407581 [Rosa chinensis]